MIEKNVMWGYIGLVAGAIVALVFLASCTLKIEAGPIDPNITLNTCPEGGPTELVDGGQVYCPLVICATSDAGTPGCQVVIN